LTDEDITDKDYEHAKKVWKSFDMKTMHDYHDLYLKVDVLLLADIMERFREICMENYELDPAWYYTSPGLAWDACLKMTRIRLDLISDPIMFNFIEKAKRGGICMISKRYAVANNKYVKNFNPKEKSTFLPYWDANNLYGWAMCEKLPYGNFEWMDLDRLKNWKNLPDGKGCYVEVDLKYPKELHDLHSDYPLAPERLRIGKVDKLVPKLNDKKKYIVHHTTLKKYIELGLIVTKVHRDIASDNELEELRKSEEPVKEKVPIEKKRKLQKMTEVNPESVPVTKPTDPSKKIKDPRRVEAGKRLAKISQQAKAAKKAKAEENLKAEVRGECTNKGGWISVERLCLVLGVGIGLGSLYLTWQGRCDEKNPAKQEDDEIVDENNNDVEKDPPKEPIVDLFD
ncbi:DNA polymerase, partial [Paramuricea clavata]